MRTATPLRALLYLRISSDPTGEAAGVDRQLFDLTALAAQLGAEFDPRPWQQGGDVFTDNDLSATSGVERPDFEQILKVQRARPDRPVILTWHVDRLVRVSKDLERVIELGCNIYAKTSSFLDLSTPAGRAVARTLVAWATYEGEQKSLRQKAAHDQRIRAGRPSWSIRPFGYSRDGSVVPGEAMTIRTAYAQLLAGASLGAIAREFNAAGWPTTMAGRDTKRGVIDGGWRQSSIRQLLIHPRNAGIITHDGEETGRGTWDPIVPEEVFRAAQRLFASPERRPGGAGTGCKPKNLLTSIAVCGTCQGSINAGVSGYLCRYRRCVTHPKDFTDTYVSGLLLHELAKPGSVDWWTPEATNGGGVEAIRAEVVAIQTALKEMAEDRMLGKVSRAQLNAATEVAQPMLRDAQARLAQAGRGSVLEGLAAATSAAAWWEELTLERRRAVVTLLLQPPVLLPRGRGVKTRDSRKIVIAWQQPCQPN